MIRKFTSWGGVVVSDASRPIKIVQERLLGPAAVVMLKAAYLYKNPRNNNDHYKYRVAHKECNTYDQ